MPEGFTKSSIEKLGERLRKGSEPRANFLGQLEAYRRAHLAPLSEAVRRIMEAGVHDECGARPKTTNSIVRKLLFLKTNLSRMQDIAGCRLVKDMSRLEQDAMRRAVVRLFPGCRVDDRRVRPSAGYRAVHVIAEVDGCFVEIQIRTELQHMWAQISERIADQLGPSLRYDDPAALEALPAPLQEPISRIRRGLLVVSDAIANVEVARARLVAAELDEALQTPPSFSDTQEDESNAIIRQDLLEATERVDNQERELRQHLQSLIGMLDEGKSS